MDKLQLFNFNNNQIGIVIDEKNEPLFCASDITKILGYSNGRDAISKHCKEKGVVKRDTLTNGGVQSVTYINESNLYRLVAKSKLPEAEKFESWVFEDILPSIRKHGAYMTSDIIEEAISNPDLIIQLATNLKAEREEKQRLRLIAEEQQKAINESKPKVLFADSVATSKDSVLVAELARILKQNGVDIGQNRLFEWLRRNGYLCSKGEYYNLPTQRAMEMGLFEVKKSSIDKPDGTILVTNTTKVTGKGQVYFVSKFIKVPAYDTAGC